MRIRMKTVIVSLIWAVVVVNGIYWITTATVNDKRGSYAGLHYGEARGKAVDAMADRYGAVIAQHLRFGKPDVVNTHLNSPTFGTGQVRIFHFIGQNGARYCVPVSNDIPYWQSGTAITKGCKW